LKAVAKRARDAVESGGTPTMQVKTPPLHRSTEFVPLERAELEQLAALAVETRRFRRHEIVRAQGEPGRDLYFLADGWVGACIDFATGSRQMVKVHLPGDLLGTTSLVLDSAVETLVALTAVTVRVIPGAAYAKLFMSNPRIAAAMFLTVQKERVLMMDRLTSVARTSATQRLAAFLLNLFDRLKIVEEFDEPRFALPLSQEELADVLGITPVHANRTFAQLDSTGLVHRDGRWITLLDVPRLRSFGAVPERRFECTADWHLAGSAGRESKFP
jgi:CRP-like cAMP-binding protein